MITLSNNVKDTHKAMLLAEFIINRTKLGAYNDWKIDVNNFGLNSDEYFAISDFAFSEDPVYKISITHIDEFKAELLIDMPMSFFMRDGITKDMFKLSTKVDISIGLNDFSSDRFSIDEFLLHGLDNLNFGLVSYDDMAAFLNKLLSFDILTNIQSYRAESILKKIKKANKKSKL